MIAQGTGERIKLLRPRLKPIRSEIKLWSKARIS